MANFPRYRSFSVRLCEAGERGRASWSASLGSFFFPFKVDVGEVHPKETESFPDTVLPPPALSKLPFVDFLPSTRKFRRLYFGAFKEALILLCCVTLGFLKVA